MKSLFDEFWSRTQFTWGLSYARHRTEMRIHTVFDQPIEEVLSCCRWCGCYCNYMMLDGWESSSVIIKRIQNGAWRISSEGERIIIPVHVRCGSSCITRLDSWHQADQVDGNTTVLLYIDRFCFYVAESCTYRWKNCHLISWLLNDYSPIPSPLKACLVRPQSAFVVHTDVDGQSFRWSRICSLWKGW